MTTVNWQEDIIKESPNILLPGGGYDTLQQARFRDLKEGEEAEYNIYHVERQCGLQITYSGLCAGNMMIYSNGNLIGSCAIEEGLRDREKSMNMMLEAADKVTVQLRVREGAVRIHSLEFNYDLSE